MDKHHVIPRHMGGSDDPSNLFECTKEEHAELHFDLYLQHGQVEDWVAAYALSGQADSDYICAWQGLPRAKSVKRKISETRKKTGRYTGDAEKRWLEGAARGGASQGRVNVESGHLKRNAEANAKVYAKNREPILEQMRSLMNEDLTHKERAAKAGLSYSQYNWYKRYL